MDYKFAGDFSKAPLGTFTEANKKLVWPSLSYDADKTGKYYSLVEDDRFPQGRACRCKYPKGGVGMADQFYQVRLKSPGQVMNLEMLWLFEPNFSFMTPNDHKTCGGKIGPCINWSEVGGATEKRGTRVMMWWNGSGSNYPPAGGTPVFSPSCQDQRTGNQLVQPVKYSRKIELDKIYKFRFQCMGGDNGWAKYWITYPGEEEILFADTGKKFLQVTPQDDVLIDFAHFSGGASHPDNEPEWDSYGRHGGVRYWSGEEYWAADDTGNGEGPTPPEPDNGGTPDEGGSPFSVAVGETKVFRARFYDTATMKEVPAKGNVSWGLTPNLVSWGPQMGPNWSALQIKGKTAGGPCILTATDSATGLSTVPVKVDVTELPREQKIAGLCVVEPMPDAAGVGAQRGAEGEFKDEPPH